jgi:hypothetical protein
LVYLKSGFLLVIYSGFRVLIETPRFPFIIPTREPGSLTVITTVFLLILGEVGNYSGAKFLPGILCLPLPERKASPRAVAFRRGWLAAKRGVDPSKLSRCIPFHEDSHAPVHSAYHASVSSQT